MTTKEDRHARIVRADPRRLVAFILEGSHLAQATDA